MIHSSEGQMAAPGLQASPLSVWFPRTFSELVGEPQSLHLSRQHPGHLDQSHTHGGGKCGANLHFWGGWPASEELDRLRQEQALSRKGLSMTTALL